MLPDGAALVNDGKIFTPFWTDPIALKPGTMGGANWPPSSYDPETHLLYVCASDRINSFAVQEDLPQPAANQVYMGGRFTQAEADDRGILAALDLTTNKLKWRQQWREICYSGSVVTAGGLLFVGRNDGRLTTLDKSNGKSLWEFMTDAGVNTTVTTFEWNGDQRVVVAVGLVRGDAHRVRRFARCADGVLRRDDRASCDAPPLAAPADAACRRWPHAAPELSAPIRLVHCDFFTAGGSGFGGRSARRRSSGSCSRFSSCFRFRSACSGSGVSRMGPWNTSGGS